MLGRFWEGFGRPKRKPKSIFGTFFFDAFFECVLASILERILEARTLKNRDFPIGKLRFSQNRRFWKSSEKTSILESFSEAKSKKNRGKIILKIMCFFDIVFLAFFFFRIFAILARFWDARGAPKINKKSKKSHKNRKKSILLRALF